MTFGSAIPVLLSSLNITIRPSPLLLPPETTTSISAHWSRETAHNPRLFNGSAFLFDRLDIDPVAGTLRAEGAPTDYATFLYWRAHRDTFVLKHIFPVGAIVTADQKLLVGRMSGHTANAGKLYPPAGSFDTSDLVTAADGRQTLDPDANIARELHEEVGLTVANMMPEPDWLLFPSTPGAFALVRILRSAATSHELTPAIQRHIAADPDEELDDVRFLTFDTRLSASEAMPYVNHLLAYLDGNR